MGGCAPECGSGCQAASGATWSDKLHKFCGFLCFKQQYKTCCYHPCDPWTPPTYEWFRGCCDGSPTPAPCKTGCNCPSCFKGGHLLFGQPTGQSSCVGCAGGTWH
jgi:hypothetical protein